MEWLVTPQQIAFHNLEQWPLTPVTLGTLWTVLLPGPVWRALGGMQYCQLAIVSCNMCYLLPYFNIYLLTAVDCGTLVNPANGAVDTSSGTTFMNTATYTCDSDYTIMGVSTRTCVSSGPTTGVWNSTAPTCEGIVVN